MFWKESVSISEHTYKTSRVAMTIGRFLGVFPLIVVKKGTQLYMKWSPFYIFYSSVLGIVIPVLTYRGLVKDTLLDEAVSIKITSITSMYVAVCDITVLELGVVFAAFSTVGCSDFFKFIKCLNEVDSVIPPNDIKQARNISILVMVVVLMYTACITMSDLSMYFVLRNEAISNSFIAECYMTFYISYYVLLMNQYKFWHLGYSILRRLRRLNEQLEIENFRLGYKEITTKRKFYVTKKLTEVNLGDKDFGYNNSDTLNINDRNLLALSKPNNINNKSVRSSCIVKLMSVYGILCDSVDILNQLYGLNNAVIIIGILWHMIETPYLLILEITGRRHPMYISVLSSWCFLHIGRLMLLAQPCYACLLEAQKTKDAVCKLLFSADSDHQFKSQLKDFSLMLIHRKFEFTASGLTAIDRVLVTSVLGAITTYLVILLQFAKSEK